MTRKILIALILLPLTIALLAFAVANRQTIVISLDPFDQAHPAIAVAMPLFALILAVLIAGVVGGGWAARVRGANGSRAARLAAEAAGVPRVGDARQRWRLAPPDFPGERARGVYPPPLSIPP